MTTEKTIASTTAHSNGHKRTKITKENVEEQEKLLNCYSAVRDGIPPYDRSSMMQLTQDLSDYYCEQYYYISAQLYPVAGMTSDDIDAGWLRLKEAAQFNRKKSFYTDIDDLYDLETLP